MHFLVIEIVSESGLADDDATLECESVVVAPSRTFKSAQGTNAINCGSAPDPDTMIEVTGYRMWPEG